MGLMSDTPARSMRKRDLHIYKETCIYEKRCIHMKREVLMSDTPARRMRKRDLHLCKETYMYGNRCIHLKRDVWMGLMQGAYDVPKRHIYIGRDSIYNKMMYAHEKRLTHVHAGCADSTCAHYNTHALTTLHMHTLHYTCTHYNTHAHTTLHACVYM